MRFFQSLSESALRGDANSGSPFAPPRIPQTSRQSSVTPLRLSFVPSLPMKPDGCIGNSATIERRERCHAQVGQLAHVASWGNLCRGQRVIERAFASLSALVSKTNNLHPAVADARPSESSSFRSRSVKVHLLPVRWSSILIMLAALLQTSCSLERFARATRRMPLPGRDAHSIDPTWTPNSILCRWSGRCQHAARGASLGHFT